MLAEIARLIEDPTARFVRVLWCDLANVIRAKAIHISSLSHFVDHGVGISRAQQAIPVMQDAVVLETGLSPVGEIRLMPDWATLTPLPYAPGHFRVMGDMHADDKPWNVCSRDFLKRVVNDANDAGLRIMAAFENEFYLLHANDLTPSDETVFAATLAMDRNRDVIDDIADALVKQDMPVELYYPESGPGQQEISIRYADALAAADRQIAFRETVHAVARQHGLRASFMPKLFADRAGSGCHLHFSLWHGDQNVTGDPQGLGGLSPAALHFIAGLEQHLPALMAVTTPSPNSYERIRPHFWSGAFRCWGLDNREAAIRVPTNPGGTGTTNVELKTVDASANPYMALAAIIAAGLDGVRRKLDPGPPTQVDPGYMTESQRRILDIVPLPATLGSALDQFRADEVLQQAMGGDLARVFQAVRAAEWLALKDMPHAQQVKLLLERY